MENQGQLNENQDIPWEQDQELEAQIAALVVNPQGELEGADEEMIQVREPTLKEMGIHEHCINCISQRCYVSIEPGVSCAVIYCPFKCGAYFHGCKADDHSFLCPNVKTACLNSSLGCQAMMRRAMCTNHLQHCPANVLMCGHSVAMEDYEDHFCCGEHRSQCEPVFNTWREGTGESTQSSTQDTKTTQEVSKDIVDGGSKTKSGRRDPLHTVPWQITEENEEETEEQEVTVLPSPTPEEALNLGLLPFGVLHQIAMELDRDTLNELALTSHFMRQLAASTLRKKGLVETRWKKVDNKWEEDGKIWRFKPAHLKPDK